MLRHTTAELLHTTTELRLAQFVGVAYFSQKKLSSPTPRLSLQKKAYGQIFNDDVIVYPSHILTSWIETRTVVMFVSQGANPPPPTLPLGAAKAGGNHLNE